MSQIPKTGPTTVSKIKARLKFPDEAAFIRKYAPNISKTGVYIKTPTPKPTGTIIRFELLLADGTPVLRGEGEVAWAITPDKAIEGQAFGMGVRFKRLDAQSKRIVEMALDYKLHNREEPGMIGAPTVSLFPPPPAPEEEPERQPEALEPSLPVEPEPEPARARPTRTLPKPQAPEPLSPVSAEKKPLRRAKPSKAIDLDDMDKLIEDIAKEPVAVGAKRRALKVKKETAPAEEPKPRPAVRAPEQPKPIKEPARKPLPEPIEEPSKGLFPAAGGFEETAPADEFLKSLFGDEAKDGLESGSGLKILQPSLFQSDKDEADGRMLFKSLGLEEQTPLPSLSEEKEPEPLDPEKDLLQEEDEVAADEPDEPELSFAEDEGEAEDLIRSLSTDMVSADEDAESTEAEIMKIDLTDDDVEEEDLTGGQGQAGFQDLIDEMIADVEKGTMPPPDHEPLLAKGDVSTALDDIFRRADDSVEPSLRDLSRRETSTKTKPAEPPEPASERGTIHDKEEIPELPPLEDGPRKKGIFSKIFGKS